MSDSELDYCLAILKALGITEVDTFSAAAVMRARPISTTSPIATGSSTASLPSITIGITDHGSVISLDEKLVDVVAQIPEGDWCNNEGGHGTVILRPQETEPDLAIECDMTYGEDEDQASDDFEDDEFVELDTDPADDSQPLAIDDSALNPNPENSNDHNR